MSPTAPLRWLHHIPASAAARLVRAVCVPRCVELRTQRRRVAHTGRCRSDRCGEFRAKQVRQVEASRDLRGGLTLSSTDVAIERGRAQAEREHAAARLLDGSRGCALEAEWHRQMEEWHWLDELAWREHRAARTEAFARLRRSVPRARGAGRPRAQASRSSSRSGDSGADDDGASSPAPRAIWRSSYELAGNKITPERRARWAELQRLNVGSRSAGVL
jgi:hypothetical protein